MTGKPSREELERRIKDLKDKVEKLSSASREQQGSEQEKAIILDSLVEHVIYEDKEMRILWANRAACESAGLVSEQLIGRHCYEVWPQRSDPCPDCPVLKAMETGQSHKITKKTPDGRAWFIRGYPVRDVNGHIIGAI